MATLKRGDKVSVSVPGVVVATNKDDVSVAVVSQTVHVKANEVEEASAMVEREANPALDAFRKSQEGGE